MKKYQLAGMISLQSMSFSIPGVTIGMITAWIFNLLFRCVIFDAFGEFWNYELTTLAVCLGILFGTLAPLISNVLPIQAALGKNLRVSLDPNSRSNPVMNV